MLLLQWEHVMRVEAILLKSNVERAGQTVGLGLAIQMAPRPPGQGGEDLWSLVSRLCVMQIQRPSGILPAWIGEFKNRFFSNPAWKRGRKLTIAKTMEWFGNNFLDTTRGKDG